MVVKDIVWDKTLSVDVNEIDEDHKRLVELYNLLHHAAAEEEEREYIEALLEELVSCTVWHFRHEERLMLKYGYDELEQHREEHRNLIDAAKSLQQRFQQQGQALSNDDINFLEHWLTGHIFNSDMRMGAYLSEAM